MLSSIVRLLRAASLVICVIVLASFAVFAVNQTSSASTHQQEELSNGPTPKAATSSGEGSIHKALDEASNKLTSPFKGITSGSSSEWVIRGVNLLLALIVYGFGLGYLARFLRVRV